MKQDDLDAAYRRGLADGLGACAAAAERLAALLGREATCLLEGGADPLEVLARLASARACRNLAAAVRDLEAGPPTGRGRRGRR
jgi:hypothetical protein